MSRNMSVETENHVMELFLDEDDDFDGLPISSSSSSDTDSEDELILKERRVYVRITNYVFVTTQYDDLQFKENFRVERRTFMYLTSLLTAANILPTHGFGRKKVSAEKAFLMTLWFLGNPETYRQISERFDVTRSCAHTVIKKVVLFLVKLSPHYITWPQGEREAEIINGFCRKQGIDGVQGVIDGSHIKINRRKIHQEAYCNRNGYHSILLQGVADHKKRFIDVFCGEAGSIHDARMLKRSALYEKAYHGQILQDTFLLGDSAYPSLRWLVPPFKDNGNLPHNKRVFNFRHSSTRIVIENTFGLLKARFRRLKFFENRKIMFIVQCVIAACVLHNVCINFDELEIPYEREDAVDDEDDNCYYEDFIQDLDRRQEVFERMFN